MLDWGSGCGHKSLGPFVFAQEFGAASDANAFHGQLIDGLSVSLCRI